MVQNGLTKFTLDPMRKIHWVHNQFGLPPELWNELSLWTEVPLYTSFIALRQTGIFLSCNVFCTCSSWNQRVGGELTDHLVQPHSKFLLGPLPYPWTYVKVQDVLLARLGLTAECPSLCTSSRSNSPETSVYACGLSFLHKSWSPVLPSVSHYHFPPVSCPPSTHPIPIFSFISIFLCH